MQADILIKNGTVITMNPQKEIFDTGYVAISGEDIIAIEAGEPAEIDATKTVDAKGGIIMPGLINTHTHIAMSGFRGLADDLDLQEWLTKHIFPAEATMKREHVYQNSLLSCVEMIKGGTTCVNDMYFYADEVAKALISAKMRGVVGETLYDFDSPNYGPLANGFAFTKDLVKEYQGHPLVRAAVNPHSPYLLAKDGMLKAWQLAEDNNALFTVHVSETENEVTNMQDNTGMTPVEYMHALGALGSRCNFAHCVVLTGNDITLLAENQVSVNLCPESNLKLASGVARVVHMRQAGINAALGTDGCASNNDQDMFGEMSLTAKLHKGVRKDPVVMDAYQVLEMATINGAKALRRDKQIGSLETGKKADIIVIDVDKPHLTPMYSAISHLVYAVKAGDVCLTMINGEILMEDYRLTGLDETEIMAKVKENALNYRQFMKM